MKFFFRGDGQPTRDYRVLHQSMDEQLRACKDYQHHLDSIAARLPTSTKEIVEAKWYQDWNHHDCPHDSWLMDLTLKAPLNKGDGEILSLNLLGAYHDRILSFTYRNVVLCDFEIQKQSRQNTGDWLRDEFDVTDVGLVSHEILWQFGKPWKIISESVEFSARDNVL